MTSFSYLLEPASYQPTSWLNHFLQHLWCWDKPRATLDSQDSPRSRLEGSHHLSPYSILYTTPRRSRKHRPPDAQKHVSKPTGIPSSGQKKEEVRKTRPLNSGPLKPFGPLQGLTARRRHQAGGPRPCSTRPHGIDRPAGRPKAAGPCLNDL